MSFKYKLDEELSISSELKGIVIARSDLTRTPCYHIEIIHKDRIETPILCWMFEADLDKYNTTSGIKDA